MNQGRTRFDFFGDLLIPIIYLLLVLLLDRIVPRTTITPLFGLLGLMVMAFCLRPFWMMLWCLIYSIVVVSVFLDTAVAHVLNPDGMNQDTLTPLVRATTFFAGSVLAAMLNASLQRSREKSRDLQEIIRRMPIPMILSDIDGRIHFMNRAATGILEITEDEQASDSYFDLLSPSGAKGKTISDYLSRFEKQGVGRGLQLEFGGISYKGSTQRIKSTNPSLLITILERSNPEPPRSEP
jgi:PAS domain-containing protein